MKVIAKWGFSYKGVRYNGGDVLDVADADMGTLRGDVEIYHNIKTLEVKSAVTKVVKKVIKK